MKLIDFTNCEIDYKYAYGGSAGRKIPIRLNGEYYFLKLPGNLKEKNMKNVVLSYSNSPISEYIGSHIYEMLGIDVHKTYLGVYRTNGVEKLVCACKDFRSSGDELKEFGQLKTTFLPDFTDSSGYETNGDGHDLQEILQTIDEHPLLKQIPDVKERFWDMFVVDALIGNSDRNNGNWGILMDQNQKVRLAPVYDNGNCLNNKWDESKMIYFMETPECRKQMFYQARTCVFALHGKPVNPYQLIREQKYPDCTEALKRLVEKLNFPEIIEFIRQIPVLSETQKRFYETSMRVRLDDVLYPVYQEHLEKQKNLRTELEPDLDGTEKTWFEPML